MKVLAKIRRMLEALPPFRSVTLAFEAGAEDLGSVIDRLGRIKAIKAALKSYEDALNAVIIEHGEKAVEGKLFRAVLIPAGESDGLDIKRIRAEMPEAWLTKYTQTNQRGAQVRIFARSGLNLDMPAEAAE